MINKEIENKSPKRLFYMETLVPLVTHELRNHLAVMGAASINIEEKIKRGLPVGSHISNIKNNILESEQIIKNFLNFAKIKTPRYELVEVLDVLNKCIASSRNKYAQWNVKVEKKIYCKKGDFIEVEPLHVSAIFSSILDNAYQSLRDKKGKIEIKAGYSEKEDKINISFKDNGSGIDKKDLPRVFKPFFTKKTKAAGLGLAVSKQTASFYGGAIGIESVFGKGTTVIVSLPVKKPGNSTA